MNYLDKLNKELEGYGEILALGISKAKYNEAINRKFKKMNIIKTKELVNYEIDNYYTYKDIEQIIYKLTSHDLVDTYIIGKTKNSNNIYALEIGKGSKVIIITAGIHAREMIGTAIILKELCCLITDNYNLNNHKIVVIPCVNPDGREMCINGNKKLKANANYVDINRNFPTSNAMQYKYGNRKTKYSILPSSSLYCGKYLGSEEETKALMAVFNKYIRRIVYYIDIHQSGNLVYGGKTYDELHKNSISIKFRNTICNKLSYKRKDEEQELTAGGEGSVTDYVTEIASGLTYNQKWRRLCYNNKPLLLYTNINSDLKNYRPLNSKLAIVTIEIGKKNSKGYSTRTRKIQNKIYNNKFKGFFSWLLDINK